MWQTEPMDTTAALATLCNCRADAYACFHKRANALFEILDAFLTTGPTLSPAHLSLAPVHRRGWGSLYAAIAHGRLARHPLAEGQPIYAVDISVWARCDAETSPQRGYYYHPLPPLAPLGRPAHRGGLSLPEDQPTQPEPR